MATLERKTRVRIVIEDDHVPAVRVMAASAVVTERAFMGIIALVAAYAAGIGVLESITFVAAAAGDGCMQTGKWEQRQIVIKANRCVP